MWSTRKRRSGSRLGHDKRDIPAFDTVLLHSNLGSLRRNYLNFIETDINVLTFGPKALKRILKIHHWWLKNKERKVDFRFVGRRFLAAINLTGSVKGALVPVFLRITHWTWPRARTARFTARPFSALLWRSGWENSARSRNQSDRRICWIPPAHEPRKR